MIVNRHQIGLKNQKNHHDINAQPSEFKYEIPTKNRTKRNGLVGKNLLAKKMPIWTIALIILTFLFFPVWYLHIALFEVHKFPP